MLKIGFNVLFNANIGLMENRQYLKVVACVLTFHAYNEKIQYASTYCFRFYTFSSGATSRCSS